MNNKHIINHLLNNKKMKKSLLFAAVLTILFAGCQKNDEKDDKVKELEVEFTLEKIEALPYGEPVNLSGSFTGTTAVSKAVFSGAKKAEDGTFTVVGEGQEGTIDGTVASVEFFADSQEIDAIEVVLSSADASKKFYFDAPKVTGEPKGDVWFNDVVALYPDNIVKNNKNCPEEFPTPNTGAGSDTKSFFSMHGVKVNGKIEHILSLNELLAVDGKNASFCFLNALQNTENNVIFGSQRGYMFSIMKASSLGGGTTGRQCDLYQYGEHQIKDENIDLNFTMNRYRGSWSGKDYKEELFKEIDRIFLNLKSPKTNLEKMKSRENLIIPLSEKKKILPTLEVVHSCANGIMQEIRQQKLLLSSIEQVTTLYSVQRERRKERKTLATTTELCRLCSLNTMTASAL